MKTTVSIEIDVNDAWLADMLYSDGFGYCRYWAHGEALDEGWLIFERADDSRPSPRERTEIIANFRARSALPPRWHLFDRDAAIRVWTEGVKRYGVDWLQTADGPRTDVLVQLALLGEVRYG